MASDRRVAVTSERPPLLAPPPRTDPIAPAGRDPVPVTLLTGFLGAGKTTLLNRILQGDHGLKVGVLVNDFGAINIDAELVAGVRENLISLTNGCVCCEIRDDLVDSLEELLAGAGSIDHVIIEASGVSDPQGIVMTLVDQKYGGLLWLDAITCVVDAEAVFADGDNAALTSLKMRQIGFADLVILNKVDLVGPEHIEVIRDWIGHHLQRIRVVEATRCEVPLAVLLGSGRFDPDNGVPTGAMGAVVEGHTGPDGVAMFDTWSFESTTPLSISAVRKMVQRRLPASVYRCKGVVRSVESPGSRLALQVVGRRTEITELGEWGERPPSTRIVVIGSSIDRDELSDLFGSCLRSPEVRPPGQMG